MKERKGIVLLVINLIVIGLGLLTGHYYRIKGVYHFSNNTIILLSFLFLLNLIKIKKEISLKEKVITFCSNFLFSINLVISLFFIFLLIWIYLYVPWEYKLSYCDWEIKIEKKPKNIEELNIFLKKLETVFEIKFSTEEKKGLTSASYCEITNYLKVRLEIEKQVERLISIMVKKEEKEKNYRIIFLTISLVVSILSLIYILYKKENVEKKIEEEVYMPGSEKLFENTELNKLNEEDIEFELVLRESLEEEKFEPILNDKHMSIEMDPNLPRLISKPFTGTPSPHTILFDPWDKFGGMLGEVSDHRFVYFSPMFPLFSENRKQLGFPAETIKEDHLELLEICQNQKNYLNVLYKELNDSISIHVDFLEKKIVDKNQIVNEIIKTNEQKINHIKKEISFFENSINDIEKRLKVMENLISTNYPLASNNLYLEYSIPKCIYKYKNRLGETISVLPRDDGDGTLYDKRLRGTMFGFKRRETHDGYFSYTPKITTIPFGEKEIYIYSKKEEIEKIQTNQEEKFLEKVLEFFL